MSDNGQTEEIKTKRCPFLNDWCIGNACALHVEIIRPVGGIAHKATLCAFNALGLILGEINQKTAPPQQKIQPRINLPNFRG